MWMLGKQKIVNHFSDEMKPRFDQAADIFNLIMNTKCRTYTDSEQWDETKTSEHFSKNENKKTSEIMIRQ